MPEITLSDGDFGSGPARVDLSAFYLPDPARPGALLIVALSDVAEIEAISTDHSRRIKDGLKLSARGFASVGPVGLAAGLLAAGRVRDVNFSVVLGDGRRFTANANADVYAEIHAAQIAARAEHAGLTPVDDLIARYRESLASDVPQPAPVLTVPEPAAVKAASAPAASEPLPVKSAASPMAASASRPVFGRRKR